MHRMQKMQIEKNLRKRSVVINLSIIYQSDVTSPKVISHNLLMIYELEPVKLDYKEVIKCSFGINH